MMGNCCCIQHKEDNGDTKNTDKRTQTQGNSAMVAKTQPDTTTDQKGMNTVMGTPFQKHGDQHSQASARSNVNKVDDARTAIGYRNKPPLHSPLGPGIVVKIDEVSASQADQQSRDVRTEPSLTARDLQSQDCLSDPILDALRTETPSPTPARSSSTATTTTPSTGDDLSSIPQMESTRSKKKNVQLRKVKVRLNPVGKVVKADNNSEAIEARRSFQRDASGACPDKRRRESVHRVLHNIGGYIIDKKTGKQIYVQPGSDYESEHDER